MYYYVIGAIFGLKINEQQLHKTNTKIFKKVGTIKIVSHHSDVILL